MSLTSEHISVAKAEVALTNPIDAVADFKKQLGDVELSAVLFFCSPEFDSNALNSAMTTAFDCPVMGCTTAGEIGNTYKSNALVGVGLPANHFNVEIRFIRDLDQFNVQVCNQYKESIEASLKHSTRFKNSRRLGFVLIDGLSVQEELTIASLFKGFEGMEIVGGSSGDYLAFQQTTVFGEGEWASNAAVFAVIETDLPFRIFKYQHFEPTETDLVITRADVASRTVYEIDGGIAAEEYAEILGLDIESLDSEVFSSHPLMLQIGDEWYVRSVQKTNPDGSLTFYCAIDEGIPLTIARGANFVNTLEEQFTHLKNELNEVVLTIGCDCILRRLEIEQKNVFTDVEKVLQPFNFIGFNSFGEQFNSIHVNQTLTGVAFGIPE